LRKILISAPQPLASRLEEKLRRNYDVQVEPTENDTFCEIKARLRRNWITVCRFANDENFKDILTMFEVNYVLKTRI
jgi:hypothetical protein